MYAEKKRRASKSLLSSSMEEMEVGRPNPSSSSIRGDTYSSSESGLQCGSERMVETELDAARVLADFAKMAQIESERRGNRRRRSRKRVKNGSPARASEKCSQDSIIKRTKHACFIDDSPQDNKAREDVVEERVEVRQNSELSKSVDDCPSSHVSCFVRGMKQNMTEAEREARRIRRVLANRESARQTIRRRQALREELTKKVADLSLDNENMKMEKELVMKEYLSLKDRNKQLKDQMAKMVKCEVEVGAEITPAQVESSTSPSTDLSLVVYSQPPYAPCIWPSWPSISPKERTCYEEGDLGRISASRRLFYVPPCAWFYPLLHQTSESYTPYSHTSRNQDADSVGRQHSLGPCSRAADDLERASLHDGSKTDISSSVTAAIKEENNASINLEELLIGFNTQNKMLESDPDEPVSTPTHVVVNPCPVVKDEPQTDVKVEKMTDHLDRIVPEKPQIASVQPHEKLVNAAAAAEARKRRKELTKLKYLHGRQVRLHG